MDTLSWVYMWQSTPQCLSVAQPNTKNITLLMALVIKSRETGTDNKEQRVRNWTELHGKSDGYCGIDSDME